MRLYVVTESEELVVEYLVVCKPEMLGRFDANFLALFGLAVSIVALAA